MLPFIPTRRLAPLALCTLLACGEGRRFFDDRGTGGDAARADVTGDLADAGPDAGSGTDVAPIPTDGSTDTRLDPDAACAGAAAMATVETAPVDIIWLVDNSVSMAPAIDQVIAGLNGFASLIASRGFDYHVVMLSLRSPTRTVTVSGSTRYAVCIPPPLAGDSRCGNGPRFFHSSIDVRSTQPLEQLLGTLGQTAGYRMGEQRGGEPWRAFLRPAATKTIVVVTDDNSRLSANDFEHFRGGANPNNSSLTLPPGLLEPFWSGLFTGYTFDGLYGWGSDTNPTVTCSFSDGSRPTSAGPVYTTLVQRTRGVRARICDGSSAWRPFFDSVASAVERTSRLACDVAIPPPPDGSVIDPSRVNVVLVGATRTLLGKVAGASACGPSGGWYYDNDAMPTRVILCPSSCDRAQTELRGAGRGIQVQFGCVTVPG
jgi:hypothetical protein